MVALVNPKILFPLNDVIQSQFGSTSHCSEQTSFRQTGQSEYQFKYLWLSSGVHWSKSSNPLGISNVRDISRHIGGRCCFGIRIQYAHDSVLCNLRLFVSGNYLFIPSKTATWRNIYFLHHFELHRLHICGHDYSNMLQTQQALSSDLFSGWDSSSDTSDRQTNWGHIWEPHTSCRW